MVWNVKGWRGPSRAIWFGGFARVCLSYTNLGTMRDDSRSVLSINLAWLTWLPVLIDLHRIDPSTPWSLNPALESRQLINFHRNLYPIGLDLEERWSRCFINIFLAQHLANLNFKIYAKQLERKMPLRKAAQGWRDIARISFVHVSVEKFGKVNST